MEKASFKKVIKKSKDILKTKKKTLKKLNKLHNIEKEEKLQNKKLENEIIFKKKIKINIPKVKTQSFTKWIFNNKDY